MSYANHLLIGTHKGLFHLEYNDAQQRWCITQQSFKAIPVSYAARDPRNGILWACLDHGHWGRKLHRSHDNGATWQEIPAPAYPEGAVLRDNKPATTSYLWTIVPGGVDQPSRVYVGTEPGGLFISDDGGDSFQLCEALWNVPERLDWWFGGGRDHPGLCSIVVDPRNSQHVTVGISVGGVYETFDGCKTWVARNSGLLAEYLPNPNTEFGHDPHFMTISPANPDILWQQNHCGVFRSTDGAKTWQLVSKKGNVVHFGFAIAVDAQNPNVAWVVPAVSDEYRVAVNEALCVCRTEDGGNTWQELRNGLPQEGCFDVVYRHALDLSGQRLAFGSTTGNVYVSDNRGEHWTCVGHHFPPVYSVRFV